MKQDYITVYTIGSLSNSTPAAETPEHTPSGFGFRHALVRLLDRFPFVFVFISLFISHDLGQFSALAKGKKPMRPKP